MTSAFAQATGTALRNVSYEAPIGIVEVTGLRRWSLEMLRDSVRVHRPGLELHDSACAAVLRQFLGFPDAQVITQTYVDSAGAKPRRFVSIKVIEPGEADRIRWATTAKADTFRVLRPSYASLILGATDGSGSFVLGPVLGPLQFGRDTARFSASIAAMPSARRATLEADAARLHAFQLAHSDRAAWRVALEAVREDGEYVNRFAAVVVLAGFGERDATWHALADALRDGQEAVRKSALTVLQILPSRTVDWTPVVPGLRALLGGTNVAATEAVLRTLARSRVSPALAGPLLHGNAEWVLAHLRSRNPATSFEARALLVQLNGGKDLGADARLWEQWLGSLPTPRS
ncbi:MAG: hypothetical protein IBJ03_06420 [Gemmatimonadaceae bacterium]|nr:hypothetical protein [Gemmatimonadaceae bacterium]